MSDRKPAVVGLALSMPIIATAAVALRFHARLVKKLRLEADDFLILAALLFCYGLSAVTLSAVFLGNLGGHLELGPGGIPEHPEQFTAFSKSLYIMQFISVPSVGLTKLSVLFFYKRLFVSRPFRMLAWAVIGLIVIWNLSFFLVNLLNCLPIEINWRPVAGISGKCIPIADIFWSMCISDILTDVVILAMPWRQIWKLQMSTSRKLQLVAVFMLGSFVVGAGIARTVLSADGVTSMGSDLDYTYSRAPAVYWTIIEADVGIMSACLPTLRPLVSSLNVKLASMGSTLRKALYWRSKSSSTSVTPVGAGSDEESNLGFPKQQPGQYASSVTSEKTPTGQVYKKERGIAVKISFETIKQCRG